MFGTIAVAALRWDSVGTTSIFRHWANVGSTVKMTLDQRHLTTLCQRYCIDVLSTLGQFDKYFYLFIQILHIRKGHLSSRNGK